ncbi:MAG: hypothetical protein A2600_10520 [Candidatus Lambdaproteobacteria bacterium RIFOXYD1_FULL_56_27]|uniref:Helix-turn-helix domain-containing protein n=1 Tax=Candidatus Lambdaproteobacteria bacterium RIFOXYD2_FULL_56_26 TaxID=1817773 RepID=A0A1F6GQN9_9PROT|nr:MAG: hypothetical protein A2557_09165 [Candidatus Lambdaproteobacteria bacterium RIFOXYD2_FULL_56_26]OGH04103.1 MAG: hypothetical protein A2426_02555 [Candidatus Lambdaproteobacteria bacterium RIFOXYC1_FULL_56_13]OGH06380.1 MAG: hypothetical protein A2600_10520 [Candidatus Lambdaproteobacteria bacterium RIFOXYD1_FULL_56_27]
MIPFKFKKPIPEGRELWVGVGSVILGTLFTRTPLDHPVWTQFESFTYAVLACFFPLYLIGYLSRRPGWTCSEPKEPVQEVPPVLGLEPAPKDAWLQKEVQPQPSEIALTELEKRLDHLESGEKIKQIVVEVLGHFFPNDWKALGERSLAREMMLNEKKASAVSGKAVKTLQNERTLMTGIPYIKDGNLVRYRLGDILDYLQDKKQRFGNY